MEPILHGLEGNGNKESDLWVTPITSGFVQVGNLRLLGRLPVASSTTYFYFLN